MMTAEMMTVTGPVPLEKIGLCSMHEHIPIDQAGPYAEDAFRFAVSELNHSRELGLKTIIEVSPRRDVAAIRRVAAETGVQIVVCTGFYTDLTPAERAYSVEQFRAHMLAEIEGGIEGSSVYPGVIKVASANAVPDEIETRLLSAAGWVQKESGLPICVHSVTGCQRQQEILAAAGANLAKVYFSHIEAVFGWEGRSLEEQLDVLTAVVAKGSFLCYNNFGNWAHTAPDILARIILWEDINPGGERRTYAYLLTDVLPWLKERGISDAVAHQLVFANPRRIFEN
jgi:phosphotriesterase-related protein